MRELSVVLRDYERQPVPAHVRKPWWAMALVNVAIGVNVGALLFGGYLAANLTFAESIGAIVLGSLLVAVIAAGCAVIGARTRGGPAHPCLGGSQVERLPRLRS